MCTHGFQTLGGATLDAHGIAGVRFVLFVNQGRITDGLFVDALDDLAAQEHATSARRFLHRRRMRFGRSQYALGYVIVKL